MPEPDQVTVAAAADLLGVRRETIYAYVSRGLLARTYGVDARGHRTSLIDRDQVNALAQRARRSRVGSFELHIDTALTELDPAGRLLYRGFDATVIAEHQTLEQVAELLWDDHAAGDWSGLDVQDVSERTWAASPDGATPSARARIAVSLMAAESPDPAATSQERREHDLRTARRCLRAAATVLAPTPIPGGDDLANTVARALAVEEPSTSTVDLVRRALVLLADHELATSTVAARAAAGTGSPLPLVLLAGAAALSGPRHGAAHVAAEGAIERWMQTGSIDESADCPSGFGHKVYTAEDPRAEHLLAELASVDPDLVGAVRALSLAVLRRHGRYPNVDLALATLTRSARLRPGAGEAIFLIARLAGITAHALEERDQPLRFRPRAVYTGPTEPSEGTG